MTETPRHAGTQAAADLRLSAAETYLSQSCHVMARLIQVHGRCLVAERKTTAFQTLATSIISQQLSARAADTIRQRVVALLPGFTASGLLQVPPEQLRAAGLSSRKVRYLIELSQQVQDGRLVFEELHRHSDEHVIATLTDLPGVGRWTAEMFLIFGLKRPDILALGDAGLQRATRLLYGETARLEEVGQKWHPYASTASWYLWKHLDG